MIVSCYHYLQHLAMLHLLFDSMFNRHLHQAKTKTAAKIAKTITFRNVFRIKNPNMHFLGLQDELYSQEDLLSVPRFSKNAMVFYHDGGHVIPPLLATLRAQVLVGIESVSGGDLHFHREERIQTNVHCKRGSVNW